MTICTECKQECKAVEETFDYAGTHCNFGRSGRHHTGRYISDCCGRDVTDDIYYEDEEYD